MFICEECGLIFENEKVKVNYHSEVSTRDKETYYVCPNCEESNYHELDTCEVCGGEIRETQGKRYQRVMPEWCPDCEMEFEKRFEDFFWELTPMFKTFHSAKDAVREWVERSGI